MAAAAGDGDPEIQLVARMITSLVSFLNVCGVAGGLFTAEEASKVQQQGRSFLLSYQTLAEEAYSTWQALWKLRPKIHYFAHMVEEWPSTLENPGRCDTFDWESFIGTIKAIGAKTHRKTIAHRTCQRYMLLLACKWRRAHSNERMQHML